MPSPFEAPRNELFAQLANGQPEGDLSELPVSEPLIDPVAPEKASEPAVGERPAEKKVWADDRSLLSNVQREQIDMAHKLVKMENDLVSARHAVIVLAIGVTVAAALMLLIVYRSQQEVNP